MGLYATSQKYTDSIPNEVTGFFNWPNPSSRTVVDRASNKNEYQESSRQLKGDQHVRLTASLPSGTDWLENMGVSQPYEPPLLKR
jgi:hypothetical protein